MAGRREARRAGARARADRRRARSPPRCSLRGRPGQLSAERSRRSTPPPPDRCSNWLGAPGAWIADLLLSLFGPPAACCCRCSSLLGLRLAARRRRRPLAARACPDRCWAGPDRRPPPACWSAARSTACRPAGAAPLGLSLAKLIELGHRGDRRARHRRAVPDRRRRPVGAGRPVRAGSGARPARRGAALAVARRERAAEPAAERAHADDGDDADRAGRRARRGRPCIAAAEPPRTVIADRVRSPTRASGRSASARRRSRSATATGCRRSTCSIRRRRRPTATLDKAGARAQRPPARNRCSRISRSRARSSRSAPARSSPCTSSSRPAASRRAG